MIMEPAMVPDPGGAAGRQKRWLPLAGLVALMSVAFLMGWHKYLSFKTIGLNYELLKDYISGHLALSLLVFMLAYIAVVALSLPGALFMTLAGGLLFGWQIGAPATVIAATIGASILFLVVNTSFGSTLAGKAGPFVARLSQGFQENALSYLLFLRLVPAFPFFIVNLVPALLGVPLRTFVIGTFLGIIPGTTAYSLAGSGLGSVIEAQNATYKSCLAANPVDPAAACPYSIDLSAVVTRELVWAGIAMGIVALIPVLMKYWSKRHAAA
jgi:uncharacterized membrane protein YdjX (TVP38/TMEM64 family)